MSLAPALTQMIVDLGQAGRLVGVAEHDAAAPPGLPVLGNYQDVNTEALIQANPTLVLTMTGREPVPQHLRRLASAHHFRLIAYPSPLEFSQVISIIYDAQEIPNSPDNLPPTCLGAVLDSPDNALRLVTRITRQMYTISSAAATTDPPSVLMVIGVDPLMASGPGTVHDQLLKHCGARNAAADAAVGAPVYDKEMLLHANPDVILMLLPGASPLGPIEADPRLASLRGLAVTAVKQNRIALINDPLAHLPSSSLPRIAAAMAKAIHPQAATAIDQAMAEPGTEQSAQLDR